MTRTSAGEESSLVAEAKSAPGSTCLRARRGAMRRNQWCSQGQQRFCLGTRSRLSVDQLLNQLSSGGQLTSWRTPAITLSSIGNLKLPIVSSGQSRATLTMCPLAEGAKPPCGELKKKKPPGEEPNGFVMRSWRPQGTPS